MTTRRELLSEEYYSTVDGRHFKAQQLSVTTQDSVGDTAYHTTVRRVMPLSDFEWAAHLMREAAEGEAV